MCLYRCEFLSNLVSLTLETTEQNNGKAPTVL